jgi:hypothetical protein
MSLQAGEPIRLLVRVSDQTVLPPNGTRFVTFLAWRSRPLTILPKRGDHGRRVGCRVATDKPDYWQRRLLRSCVAPRRQPLKLINATSSMGTRSRVLHGAKMPG